MCTAISFKAKDHYFGRTLDVEFDCNPNIVITPRNFDFHIKGLNNNHYAIIGMALAIANYPFYFDATNEKGLSIAGLNFPKNAHYFDPIENKNNLAAYEIIPYILGKCKNIDEARNEFKDINITNVSFVPNMPQSPLHWIVSDQNASITIEQTIDGLKIFENPVGALTNNPTFDWHITNLTNYLNLSSDEPINRLSKDIDLTPYCKGMGSIGLPGDVSSASRFIRVCFNKLNAKKYDTEIENVNQFFHILDSVSQIEGCAKANQKQYEKTVYTSCCNTTQGIYYYNTYSNKEINGVSFSNANLDDEKIIEYIVDYTGKINIK